MKITNDYQSLKEQIKSILSEGRKQAFNSVNTILVKTYWNVGKYIVEYEQNGKIKAGYGKELLTKLAKDLTVEYGKGFSRSNLTYMRKFYLTFPKSETLSHKLSWSHYFEILKADDPLEINFYIKPLFVNSLTFRKLHLTNKVIKKNQRTSIVKNK